MAEISLAGIEISRCVGCHGIWVEIGAMDTIVERGLARQIDSGDPAAGRRNDGIALFPCPKCEDSGRMIQMEMANQPRLVFEHCAVCHGAYFDAGELIGFSEHTLADFIKDALVEKRQ
jgi:Zn-finger nucleic acid-binding protein